MSLNKKNQMFYFRKKEEKNLRENLNHRIHLS